MGAAGDLNEDNKRFFTTLLEIDIIRGEDSTGVMINKEEGPVVFKDVGVPWVGLYRNKKFLQAINEDCNLLLGHNRSATVGTVTKENAHPFKCDHIIGAHNGTVFNREKLEGNKDFEVDSHNIFHHMSIHGVEETVNKLQGAFALVWYNEQEGTINFIRNSQRTLYFAFSKNGRSLFWASEQYFLSRVAQKVKVALDVIHPFKELYHYKVVVPPIKGTHFQKKFGKLRIKKLLPHRYQQAYRGESGVNRYVAPFFGAQRSPLCFPLTQQTETISKNFLERLHKNSPIYFVVDSVVAPQKGWPYLTGHVLAHPTLEVRLNPVYKTEKWYELSKTGELFFGNVKKVKEGYLLINVSTVKPRISEPAEEAILDSFETKEDALVYSVGGGRLVSKANFLRLIEPGCAVCANPLFLKDAKDLDWYLDSPVCSNCHVQDVIYS